MPASKSFLQIAGVNGDSKDPKHQGWIELLGWSLGPASDPQPSSGSSGSAGGRVRAQVSELHFVMRAGAVSASLARDMDKGTNFKEVTLEELADNRLTTRIVLFGGVYVSGVVHQSSNVTRGEGAPATITLDFLGVRTTFGDTNQTSSTVVDYLLPGQLPSFQPAYGG